MYSARGLKPAPLAADGKRLTAGTNRPVSSIENFNSAVFAPGFSRYQPSSITTYCQPNCFRCLAIHSALARTWASVMVSLYESQLFQPMGGTGASSLWLSRG